MTPWTKKYLPKNTQEIVGQDLAVDTATTFLSTKKPILLHGPTGVGKTTLAYALAKERNFEVFEINSSDLRNKATILERLGSSMVQQSLFSKGKIILIDDIDALSGRKDRGGLTTIISLMAKTKHPIILTCTDPWIKKLSSLRKKTKLVELKKIKKDVIKEHLQNICKKENIKYKEEDISLLAKKAQGDLRAAITDLQTNTLNQELKVDETEERARTEDINFCLRKILKSKKWEDVFNVFYKVDMDINECMLWLDENMPREYNSEARKKAYEHLSRADVFNGRIRRWQHWRFLVYMNTHLTSGIAFAKQETNPNFIEYKRSERILKLWLAKQRNAKKNSIAEKIAERTHTSRKQAVRDSFPFLKRILLTNRNLQKELELNEEEIAWLKK